MSTTTRAQRTRILKAAVELSALETVPESSIKLDNLCLLSPIPSYRVESLYLLRE